MDARYGGLGDAARLEREFVDGLPTRAVGASADLEELRGRLGRPLSDRGEDLRALAGIRPGSRVRDLRRRRRVLAVGSADRRLARGGAASRRSMRSWQLRRC